MDSPSGTVEIAKYIMADVEANNNKYWHATILPDNTVETHWGRVGEDGQRKKFPHSSEDRARNFFDRKCKEKEKKGYQRQRTLDAGRTSIVIKEDLKAIAQKQIETSCPETSALVAYLTERNVHNILASTTLSYDTSKGTFSTPLGIVTADAISQARNLLTNIGKKVSDDDYDNPDLVRDLNQYLMLIPQNIGRQKPNPRYLYPDLTAVQRQNALLDSLEASLQSVLSAPQSTEVAETPKLFEVKLSLVEDSKEIDRIRKKYQETKKTMHESSQLDVHKVYLVEITNMRRAFETDGAKMDNIWELWHGTRVGNLLSILKKGFFIPPAQASYCTGRMFGNGIYHSDQSTKSLNYAYGYWDGGNRDQNCFMFLNNVAMGNYYTPKGYSESLPKQGYDSTFAEAGKSGVMNNEMIIYRCSQMDPVFLIQFSSKKGM